MTCKVQRKLKEEAANSLVENVIVLPLIFIIIYMIIVMCFVIHDRSTLEAAARRGAIYASHCISDPKYATILQNSGNESGTLDTSIENAATFSFTGIASNIEPYRYLKPRTAGLEGRVHTEVQNIIEKTRIPWNVIQIESIEFDQHNLVFYQDITVSVKASYPVPEFFHMLGFPEDFSYVGEAKMTVNDPDEFIRNVDMAVDVIQDIDDMTGNHLSKVQKKIAAFGDKIKGFINSLKIE